MAHSFLPPSGASAWSKCALWPTMNARFPQESSPFAIEGTAAHWVGWEMLAERPITEGQSTSEGVIVTGEMLDGAELLTDTIAARMKGMTLHIEETVPITLIGDDCFGTPDIWGFDPARAHLEIIDYKFGHRFVDEYFNPQGILYLLGILEKIRPQVAGNPAHISVSFTIVQPRCYHQERPVRTHSFTVKEIHDHYLPALQAAAMAARSTKPVATTNSSCNDCPGRHACSALQQAAYSDAEFSNDRQPHDLSPAAAALELRMLERALERLEARVDGLRELTLANLKAGARLPYYRIGEGKGRQQWNIPTEQVITIGQMFGKNLSKPGVLTPSQAKKLGMDETIISGYSFVPSGNLKLVAENPSDARKVFGNSGE